LRFGLVFFGQSALARLVELIDAIPPARRATALQCAISFRPSPTLELEFAVGPLRAAFAHYWEQCVTRRLPLEELRLSLDPPIPIKTVLEFSKFALTQDATDIECAVNELVRHLIERIAELAASPQRWLFENAKREQQEARPLPVGQSVQTLQQLLEQGRKFATIYADPPWQYENEASRAAATNHYATMSVDDICAEPISDLAEDNAHLHLWTTSSFLPEALHVIDAWGFQFKSSFVWIKPQIGLGNYWRVSHEFLLLGVRGNLTFSDRSIASWIQAHRTIHSRKPGIVRELIERVSPGPYLELYGREELPDSAWTVYGNQIERRLF